MRRRIDAKALPYAKAMAFAYFSMARKAGFRKASAEGTGSFPKRIFEFHEGRMVARLGIRPVELDPSPARYRTSSMVWRYAICRSSDGKLGIYEKFVSHPSHKGREVWYAWPAIVGESRKKILEAVRSYSENPPAGEHFPLDRQACETILSDIGAFPDAEILDDPAGVSWVDGFFSRQSSGK